MQLVKFQTASQVDEHPIATELRDVVTTTEATRPRSTQVAIGPSELGQPCLRRLAYKLMDEPPINVNVDRWFAIIGTAVHTWLADAFTEANTRLGRIRYLVETRVQIRPGLFGSCDLYDVDRATVLDNKVVGVTKLRDYRINGPGEQYETQIHAYGMGLAQLGLPVEHVAIAFYPRSAGLTSLHIWSAPYNPHIVTAALARHDNLIDLICELDVEHHPDRYQIIPKTPSRLCHYCPWFRPGPDTGIGCPGNMLREQRNEETWN